MPEVCVYFQVHQPMRLSKYSFFDIGSAKPYFDFEKNKELLERVVRKCYQPANELILSLLNEFDGKFKVNYSITGILLKQLEELFPEIIDSFKAMAETGSVEFFGETYYHSLSYLISEKEFKEQVKMHLKKMKKEFNAKPKIFRNTEAMYCNRIAKLANSMGFKGIIAEGLDSVLGWRSPNYVYAAKNSGIKVLLRNYRLSDDIGFRFSEHSWKEFPLTAEKYAYWISKNEGQCVNIFLDYETFGEHQWKETGIFDFLKHLPSEILKHKNLSFSTATELVEKHAPIGEFDVPFVSSWADVNRDLSAWLENKMQKQAFTELINIGKKVLRSKNAALLDAWRKLQTSDHFYYMCTKWFADGDVHKYFNPYDSPYDAFLNYMNVLKDLEKRVGYSTAKSESYAFK